MIAIIIYILLIYGLVFFTIWFFMQQNSRNKKVSKETQEEFRKVKNFYGSTMSLYTQNRNFLIYLLQHAISFKKVCEDVCSDYEDIIGDEETISDLENVIEGLDEYIKNSEIILNNSYPVQESWDVFVKEKYLVEELPKEKNE